MGRGDELGTVAAGKLADLLVVDGNPLDRHRRAGGPRQPLAIIKGGRLVKDRLPDRHPRSRRVGDCTDPPTRPTHSSGTERPTTINCAPRRRSVECVGARGANGAVGAMARRTGRAGAGAGDECSGSAHTARTGAWRGASARGPSSCDAVIDLIDGGQPPSHDPSGRRPGPAFGSGPCSTISAMSRSCSECGRAAPVASPLARGRHPAPRPGRGADTGDLSISAASSSKPSARCCGWPTPGRRDRPASTRYSSSTGRGYDSSWRSPWVQRSPPAGGPGHGARHPRTEHRVAELERAPVRSRPLGRPRPSSSWSPPWPACCVDYWPRRASRVTGRRSDSARGRPRSLVEPG